MKHHHSHTHWVSHAGRVVLLSHNHEHAHNPMRQHDGESPKHANHEHTSVEIRAMQRQLEDRP